MNLLAELKRRRVARVAGGYLVGAWIMLQIADTLFPALHLPPWTVTLVAGICVVGFPIALILGWVFDLTPGGIERTTSTETKLAFPARAAAIGTIVVALGITGFIAVQRRAVAAKLDANAVVVLPFRVAGDASLEVMREGMVDLMAAKLTGEGGPRAIDSRTTLSAWRRRIDDEAHDMPTADAVQLARSLGAGQLLLGEVIGTPGRVTLNLRLNSAVDGTEITSAQDAAPPDSMLQLIDRVVATLLSQQAGQSHRTQALLSESLVAVQAYLDGQRLYRSGDHYGASDRFKAALEEDSTFALAGLGLAIARSWSGRGPDFTRGRRIAWQYRDRLPQPDRDYVVAWMGENYPDPTPDRVKIETWKKILAAAPDRIEAWYALGDEYYHMGAAAGIPDALEKALEAWKNAVRRDSAFVPALDHQLSVLAGRGDTVQLRKLATMLFDRIEPENKYRSINAWPAALALHDEDWLKGLRAAADTLAPNVAFNAYSEIIRAGLPQQDVPHLIQVAIANSTPQQASNALFSTATVLLNIGKPAAALAQFDAMTRVLGARERAIALVGFAMDYGDLDSAAVAAAARQAVPNDDVEDLCILSEQRMLNGDVDGARISMKRIRELTVEPFMKGTANACLLAAEAGIKVHDRSGNAADAVAALDTALVTTFVVPPFREHLAFTSARLHAALGDYNAAYEATLRVQRDVSYGLAPMTLARARYAVRANRRDDAIANYTLFLKFQADPEPGAATETVERARAELAALLKD